MMIDELCGCREKLKFSVGRHNLSHQQITMQYSNLIFSITIALQVRARFTFIRQELR